MKILQLITSLRVGGAEMLAVQMADMLRLRGHEVGIAVNCVALDPRYLTEEGYVQLLYLT